MATNQVSYIGIGSVYIGKRSGGKMRFVGQVPSFKLEFTETTKELVDHVNGGGGLADSVSFVSKVIASIDFESISASNIALALRGDDSSTTSMSKTGEAYIAYPGGLIPLSGVSPSAVIVTVDPTAWVATTAYTVGQIVKPTTGTHFYKCKTAGSSGGTAPTWKTDGTDTTDGTVTWTDMGTMVLDTSDYDINSAGVFIHDDAIKIDADGTPVKVSYTTSAGFVIQALVDMGTEYRILFAGKNFARNDSGLNMDIYRAKFSPAKDLSLIGDDFAKLTLTANLLSDDTKTGTGISKFAAINMEAV